VVSVTGKQSNLATGTVTITAAATALPAGSQLNIGTSGVNIKQWDGILPGVDQTWTRIQTP
jgi:hypothetical protein